VAAYTIRDIDDDLWKRVKIKAAQDGKPIRTVILDLLTKYAASVR
jgi:plasmid stability protein